MYRFVCADAGQTGVGDSSWRAVANAVGGVEQFDGLGELWQRGWMMGNPESDVHRCCQLEIESSGQVLGMLQELRD